MIVSKEFLFLFQILLLYCLVYLNYWGLVRQMFCSCVSRSRGNYSPLVFILLNDSSSSFDSSFMGQGIVLLLRLSFSSSSLTPSSTSCPDLTLQVSCLSLLWTRLHHLSLASLNVCCHSIPSILVPPIHLHISISATSSSPSCPLSASASTPPPPSETPLFILHPIGQLALFSARANLLAAFN